MTTTENTSDRELVTRRVINAPSALVFEAFLDPKHIGLWWGPNGFTTTTISMEPKVGGEWRYTMHGPDGTDYPNLVRYTEITKPQRLCYDHRDGEKFLFRTEITLVPQEMKTELTMRLVCDDPEWLANMKKFGAVEGIRRRRRRPANAGTPG
jgi:uncharacterized protein YndB with AHSA1/START domain